MSLNWREINLILSELPLEGAHIQGITQPEFHTLIFELFNKGSAFSLLLSVEQNRTRLHSLTGKTKGILKLQRFAQFLRSRVKGGRIISAGQLGRERIVKFLIKRGEETLNLYCRLWSGNANIIVTDGEDQILDALYRRPKKGEITGGKYKPEMLFETSMDSSQGNQDPDDRYPLRDHPQSQSFNSWIEQEYKVFRTQEDLESLRTRAEQALEKKVSVLQDSFAQKKERLKALSSIERSKEFGDLILSNLGSPLLEGRWLRVSDFFNEGRECNIEIDSMKTLQENAEGYYERFKKEKRTQEYLQKEILDLEREITRLEQLKASLDQEESSAKLKALIGKTTSSPSAVLREKKTPGLTFFSGGFTLHVGRTASENDELLRKLIRGNDLWLHARDYPGSYVFIKAVKGKTVPLEVLIDAGNLALYYSKGRSAGKGNLYYTQAKYLRRAKEGKKGTVIPFQEKNLTIALNLDRIRSILDSAEE